MLVELNKQNNYAYTTIMTIINRLDNKGILTHSKFGKDTYISHITVQMSSFNKIQKWSISFIITEILPLHSLSMLLVITPINFISCRN
ncbi:BlaI/MecI/CopY family transcriptional regulator [Metabacillus idriensis]|uniref:BlaI/MecI/CopY family transcriptional regulator n=1 Tax=Metabacillus idriensis TaxID=324768 RepID=UPI0020419CB7|nr:BlaI/MecI/CopY family transcriptional regulator [Metabacillus idriensis]MCM3595622.1 BlaI/MecI/CopY family transcriptional regulator [Metabacillus idriensis]